MAEWSALLLHIQDVLDSNLGPETGYSDSCDFLWSKFTRQEYQTEKYGVTTNWEYGRGKEINTFGINIKDAKYNQSTKICVIIWLRETW
jgi:hypothetical protein